MRGQELRRLGADARIQLTAIGLVIILTFVAVVFRGGPKPIAVGKLEPTPSPTIVPIVPDGRPVPPALNPSPLLGASDYGPGGALAFRGAVNVPKDLQFFLVIGSDARPGEQFDHTRGDSIHVVAIDPRIAKGTVLGIPRDSYVPIPGHGTQKINSALAYGGPQLLAQTVHNLTGFPISYYAVTGFDGFVKITNALGGADIYVPYDMDDRAYSGADFKKGWHHMDGNQVLAFSRDRHSLPNGDFGRSFNQGGVILDALRKLRAETSDETGIRKWLNILFAYARLNLNFQDALRLGVFARQIAPADLVNVVTPGTAENVGGQSVVMLGDDAYRLFRDIGADALADGKQQREAPPPTPTPRPPAPTPTPGLLPTPTPPPHGILPL
jgi:LCP family protein required for cell wall assembly